MDDFYIRFSDVDKKIWDSETVHCRPKDKPYEEEGSWDSDSNHDDVFGPGTGNHGWYTWRPKQGLLFLNRPGQNNKGLENSLIRFFAVKEITNSEGKGLAYYPGHPAKEGKSVSVEWDMYLSRSIH
jgi:hypothetical protein